MKAIYNTGSDFRDLRRRNCVYVDKTCYLHRLITDPGQSTFFIARPRRFGKSLMISTLKHIFQGHRDFFKGLYIDTQTGYDWKTYPVLHLDFSDINTSTESLFEEGFAECIEDALAEVGLTYNASLCPSRNMESAIITLSEVSERVIVLVDEYDTPIVHALKNPSMAEHIRIEMARFYTTLKKMNSSIRFLMITGITALPGLSDATALNSPQSISLNPDYAAMLGYTETELETYFSEHMRARAEALHMPYDTYRTELKHWFNGYRFTKAETKVYNPISIGQTLTSLDDHIGDEWSHTGRPMMLATFLKTHDITSLDFENGIATTTKSLESASDIHNLKPLALLYQTGYLTITQTVPGTDDIVLGFPDEEVRRDMYRFLADISAGEEGWCQASLEHLSNGRVDEFLKGLAALYAGLPANANDGDFPESHYQGVLKAVMLAGGFLSHCEYVQSSKKTQRPRRRYAPILLYL